MKTIYKDVNGNIISYGDILKDIYWEKKCPKSEYSPQEPYFMITKCNGETMMYFSGMDEFYPIEECKLKTDKIDELKSFRIYAYRKNLESLWLDTQNLYK